MADHQVVAYGSGREALAEADRTAFDVVLTDVLMPDMDGVEILRTLVKREQRPRIIVITGGSAMQGMDFLAIAPALGADSAIAKPIRARALLAAVDAVLEVSGTPARSRRA
jgi:CheY-like chemotaxis protein